MRPFALITLASLTALGAFSLLPTASAADVEAPGFKIEKTHEVEGAKRRTRVGDTVLMHYRGTLASNGKEFDASYNRGQPLKFKVGAGMVIKG